MVFPTHTAFGIKCVVDEPISRDCEWHELAKIWQIPVVGEQWMTDFDKGEFSHQLESLGIPANLAPEVAGRIEETMRDCILRLYRSAIHVGDEWESGLVNLTSPGLVF